MSYILNSEDRLFVMLSDKALAAYDSGDKVVTKWLTDTREACKIGDMDRAERSIKRVDKRVETIGG